ncbi:hypothetical protein J7K19_05745 [bacterium]|nr:hypothetical protein [bacterium]
MLVAVIISSIGCINAQPDSSCVRQIVIPFGDEEEKIRFPELCDLGDMDVDDDGNIFIADWMVSSIKKYSPEGKYLGKLTAKGIQFVEVVCYDHKLYSFYRGISNENDLYIFSTTDMKLIEVKKRIFPWYLTSNASRTFDDKLVFRLFKSPYEQKYSYQVYDLVSDEMFLDLDSPFHLPYLRYPFSENETLLLDSLGIGNPAYLGRVDHWLLFVKSILEPKYSIFFLNVNDKTNQKKLEITFKVSELGNMTYGDPINHWRFKKKRWLYYLGYRDDNVLISRIDLKNIFSEVYQDSNVE